MDVALGEPDLAETYVPRCSDSGVVHTRSIALTDWPTFDPVVASDLSSTTPVDTLPVPGTPAGIVVTRDGNSVFAALRVASGTSQLAVLRRSGTGLTLDHMVAMPTGQAPFGLALSRDGALLAVGMSDNVAVFDVAALTAGAPQPSVMVPTHAAQHLTIDVAFSADARLVFAALEYDHAIAVIDVTRGTFVGAIPIDGSAVTGVIVSPDGSRAYAVCEAATEFVRANPMPTTDQVVGSITVIDVAMAATQPRASVIGHALAGRAPVRAALSPDGAVLWVTARGSNSLLAFDTANLLSDTCDPLLANIAVGPAPVGLTIVRGGAGIAVADSNRFADPRGNQTVSFVNAARALAGDATAVVGQVGVGAFPREMDSDENDVFVSNANSASVSAVDLQTLPF
jgi:DNA-binding beta-propeller fold protein YncE